MKHSLRLAPPFQLIPDLLDETWREHILAYFDKTTERVCTGYRCRKGAKCVCTLFVVVCTCKSLERLSDQVIHRLYLQNRGSTAVSDRVLLKFRNDTNLQQLTLSSRDHVNLSLRSIRSLTSLDLSDCARVTGDCVSMLTWLTRLNLNRNGVIKDDHLRALTGLTTLSLFANTEITDDGVRGLTNLTELDLGRNNIIKGHCFPQLIKLNALNLVHNKVISAEALRPLQSSLTTLILRDNERYRDVSGLTNLTALAIHHDLLGGGISELTKLKVLDLSFLQMGSDDILDPLVNIEALNIYSFGGRDTLSMVLKGKSRLKVLSINGSFSVPQDELPGKFESEIRTFTHEECEIWFEDSSWQRFKKHFACLDFETKWG